MAARIGAGTFMPADTRKNLLALPIFSDEAIYLRWAQLIRAHPLDHAFVSLVDPKPPLHFWLMALIWRISSNPLFSAQFVSVIAGVATVPVLLLLCRSLEPLVAAPFSHAAGGGALDAIDPPKSNLFGPVACILMILCPFMAFYQRMALADALFVLESAVAAWLSIEFAMAIHRPTMSRPIWATLGLGVVMGLTMLTRQNVSYVLWILPVAVFFLAKSARTRSASVSLRYPPGDCGPHRGGDLVADAALQTGSGFAGPSEPHF